ncbi:nitroreductase family protein [Pseudomonas matsuisoli]|uniref:Putative NAD(P)H nitroreductase n=1 Tax=Pseudomonas matsuisoli TaxID=1515666 RepID=A0A917PTL9_9PSED|nr:nitroreductase family protein [Pseudomonas matsuisoli]GGJ91648.1 nitroreductase [Pseudomonas matsuisoli]
MDALELLTQRVSIAKLTDPAPDAGQRETFFRAALRAPDHGLLRPWRFLTVEGSARDALGDLFAKALEAGEEPPKPEAVEKARRNPLRAPLIVVVIARVLKHPKVPALEQRLAAGCAAHGILQAAYAMGIGAIWRSGPLAYDPIVAEGLGLAEYEECLGFLYMGTPDKEPRTAPQLSIADFVSGWRG